MTVTRPKRLGCMPSRSRANAKSVGRLVTKVINAGHSIQTRTRDQKDMEKNKPDPIKEAEIKPNLQQRRPNGCRKSNASTVTNSVTIWTSVQKIRKTMHQKKLSLFLRHRTPKRWRNVTSGSCHMTHSLQGLSDLEKQTLEVTMGDGKSMITTQVGKWSGVAIQKDGTTKPIMLNKVVFIPKVCVNLFGITQVMKLGATLSSTSLTIFWRFSCLSDPRHSGDLWKGSPSTWTTRAFRLYKPLVETVKSSGSMQPRSNSQNTNTRLLQWVS